MNKPPKSNNDTAILRQERAEAISAIEGQILTDEQRRRISAWEKTGLSPEQQRVEILSLYRAGFPVK